MSLFIKYCNRFDKGWFTLSSYLTNNSYTMLQWCKNRPQDESYSEILIEPLPYTQAPPHPGHQQPPKFSCPSQRQIRKIKPTPRRGSANQIEVQTKVNKEVQTVPELQVRRTMVNSSTQTHKMTVQQVVTYRNGHSHVNSRDPSPRGRLENSVYLKIDYQKPSARMLSMDRSRKQSGDFKFQNNVQTKATYCLADTKDKLQFCDKSKLDGIFGVQSYNIPSSQRLYEDQGMPGRHVCFKESQIINGLSSPLYLSNNRRQDESEDDLTFSSKYREMYKNVQKEFKQSQEKSEKYRSLKHLKCTPERPDRRMLYERETIMSKFTNSNARSSQKQILIEESIIVQREISSLFTPLTREERYSYFSLYLARENRSGLVVSIKELSIMHMDHISEELLIYKQLQTKNAVFQGILELYQTQIDRTSYLFIKEPYSENIKQYLEQQPNLAAITGKVNKILENVYSFGFLLRRRLKLQDLVAVNGEIKIQNAGIFTLDDSCGCVSVDEALLAVRGELLQCFQ